MGYSIDVGQLIFSSLIYIIKVYYQPIHDIVPPGPRNKASLGYVAPQPGVLIILIQTYSKLHGITPKALWQLLYPPPLQILETLSFFFNNLKRSGIFFIGLLDARNVAIQLSNDLDYSRIFF
ncbi:hypothetical protein IEQ34_007065 [Dendrobium chrysotoxum]|uniref:Uncharacterized protein n=1 Tax=Dendrobium chrysotoxum TaxID=161865 RepID=A0AAV7GS38_DENCH|nr:hypothetical protein IEQ34_007065 [Dendrobium chrysotoxum]